MSNSSEPAMKFLAERFAGLSGIVGKALLLVMPLTYGAVLMWQEWSFRQSIALMPLPAPAQKTTPARETLDATAVATVLGFTAATTLQASAEPLTLQASFVNASGLSRALLADSQGSRIYQVGDRLPGGSVLRRVEPGQVVLWNKGREELLTLQSSAARFLRPFELQEAPHATPARFLRPISGPSE
ncbi:type II secretion system protein N [Pseudomonas sp. LB3P31]